MASIKAAKSRKCPSALAAALARNVLLEIKTVNLDEICHTNTEFSNALGYEPVELWRIVISKVHDICHQWQDANENDLRALASLKQNVSMCAIKNSRRTMEDRHVVIQDLNILFGLQGHPQTSFFAVFDGHAGSGAACYSAVHLHYNVIHHPSYPHDIKTAMKEGFMKTDKNFLSNSNREGLKSGSTALCCLLRDKEMYLAWLGDSQAILVREGAAIEMMKPHKPDREDERERIEKLGGCVVHYGTWRVNGTLAVSRAIGDAEYKPFVCSEPDVELTQFDGTEDFIILACDGLWDVLQPKEVVGLVYRHLAQNNGDIDSVAAKLVQVAKEKGSGDNITVLAVFLRSVEQMCNELEVPETPEHNPISFSLFEGIQQSDQIVPVNGNPFGNMVELTNSEAISFETFGSESVVVDSPSLGINDPLGEFASADEQVSTTTPNFPQDFAPEWGVKNFDTQGHLGGGDVASEYQPTNVDLDRPTGDFPQYENPFCPPLGSDNPFYEPDTVDPAFELSNAATGNFFEYKPDAEKKLVEFESGPGDCTDNVAAPEEKESFGVDLNKGLFDSVKPFQSNLSPDAEPFVMVTRSPVQPHIESEFPAQSMAAYIEAEPFTPNAAHVPGLQEPAFAAVDVPAEIPSDPLASVALATDGEQFHIETVQEVVIQPRVPFEDAQSPIDNDVQETRLPTFIDLKSFSPLPDPDSTSVDSLSALTDQVVSHDLKTGDNTSPFDESAPVTLEVLTNVETIVSEVRFDYLEDSSGHGLDTFKSDVDLLSDIKPEAVTSTQLELGSKDLNIPLLSAVVDVIPDTVPVADDVEDDESEDGEEWKFYKSDATEGEVLEMKPADAVVIPEVETTAQVLAANGIAPAESLNATAESIDLDASLPVDSQNSSYNDLGIVHPKTANLPAPDLVQPSADEEKPKPAEAPNDATKPKVPKTKTAVKASAAPKAPAGKAASSKPNDAAKKPLPKTSAATKPTTKPVAASAKPLTKPAATKPLAAKPATAKPPTKPAAVKALTKPAPTTNAAAPKKVPLAAENAKKVTAAAARPKPAPMAKVEVAPRVPLSRPATAPAGKSSTVTLATAKMSKEQINVRSKAPAATNGLGKETKKLQSTASSVTARLTTKTSSATVRETVKRDASKPAAAGRLTATRVDMKQTKETVNKQIVGVGKRVGAKVEVNGIKAPAATSSPKASNDKETSPPKARTPLAKASPAKSPILAKSKTPGKSPVSSIRERESTPKSLVKTSSSPRKPIRKSPAAATATITGSSPAKVKVEDANNEKGILDATSKENGPTENGLENHSDQPNTEESAPTNGINGGNEAELERLECDGDLVLI